jgi:tetratricopeptide (TPR) repeat protein
MLVQAARAELELKIAPPTAEWLLPPTRLQPCGLPGGFRLESCPRQLYPEGVPLVGEESLVAELAPLIAAENHGAVLARIAVNYGPELALLEAGDAEGFLRTRVPSAGAQAAPFPSRAGGGGSAPAMNLVTNRARGPGDSTQSAFADRRGTGRAPDTISAAVLYVIGHSYFSLQRYRPAETAFELALVALPNHVRAHESLGMLYLELERYADARVHLARAVELGRNTAHVHTALGYLDQRTHHHWAAANAFQKALVLEPDNRSAQRGLLHALTETREHVKARALVEQLLRADPDDPGLWLYRAQIALATDERASALASLETALRLGDDSIENLRACIALHLESGNIARAVELLQASPAPGPAFPHMDQALAWLANESEWAAFRALSASVDGAALRGAEQSRLLTRRASLALSDGNRRAARTALEEALALDPSNADALMALGQLYRAARDYGRADLLFQRASAYGAVREKALVARAEVAIDQENYDSALVLLRGVVTVNPARADLRRNIAVLENLALLRTRRE